MRHWSEHILHPALRDGAETRRRAQLTAHGSLVLSAVALAYAAFYGLLVGYPAGARILVLGALGGLLSLVLLRVRPWLHAAGQLITFACYGVVVGLMVCEGGVRALATPLLSTPPILAILLLGRRWAAGWTAACVLTIAAFGGLEAHGARFPILYPAAWAQRMSVGSPVALVLCTALLLVVVEKTRAEAQSRAEEAHVALARLAFRDALTGLANRAHFLARLDAAVGAAQAAGAPGRVTVLMLDLDGFKGVNDTLGHAAGDAVLAGVGARLRTAAVGADTVARLGGDEFAVLLDRVSGSAAAETMASRIVAAMSCPFVLDAGEARIGTSVGIARAQARPAGAPPSAPPTAGETAAGLLHDADLALYQAKAWGRGQWAWFEAGMRPGVPGAPRPARCVAAPAGLAVAAGHSAHVPA